ncbi:peptidase C14, partial [Reticulomyxa filosa]
IFTFLDKFAKSVEDIFLNEDPPIIVQYLTEINSSGEDDDANQCILNQLKIALKHDSSVIRVKAAHAVSYLGPESHTKDIVDQLILSLKDCDWDTRVEIAKISSSLKPIILAAALRDANSKIRKKAAKKLQRIGSAAAAAAIERVLDELTVALKDMNKDVRLEVIRALGSFGSAAATHAILYQLAETLKDTDVDIRLETANTLGLFGPAAATEKVLHRLVVALHDTDSNVAKRASKSLGLMGASAMENVTNRLIIDLKSDNWTVRRDAAQKLGLIGQAAALENVLHQLTITLKDKNEGVRWNAIKALSLMGPAAATEKVLDALIAVVLNDEERYIYMEAAKSLYLMGSSAAIKKIRDRLGVDSSDEDLALNALFAPTESTLDQLDASRENENLSVHKSRENPLENLSVLSSLVIASDTANINAKMKSAKKEDIWKCQEIIDIENLIREFCKNWKIESLQTNELIDETEEKKVESNQIPLEEKVIKEMQIEHTTLPRNAVLWSDVNESTNDSVNNDEKKNEDNVSSLNVVSDEKKQELKTIEKNEILCDYYNAVVATLNNVFFNMHGVHCERVDSMLPMQNFITKEADHMEVKDASNVLTISSADSMQQYSTVETLAYFMTITQQQNLLSLPSRLLCRLEIPQKTIQNIKNTVAGSDCNTVIRRKAQYDCNKLIVVIGCNITKLDLGQNIEHLVKLVLNLILSQLFEKFKTKFSSFKFSNFCYFCCLLLSLFFFSFFCICSFY